MKQSSFVSAVRSQIAARRESERCLIPVQRGHILRLPLIYPSPYRVGMSSLGYQVVYRLLNDPNRPAVSAERAFLPDDVDGWKRARQPLLTYESQARVEEAPVILFSVAYELELIGLFQCLELAGIPVLRSERTTSHPLVICGGPLTFSNPTPLHAFADVVVMGESENVLPMVIDLLLEAGVGTVIPSESERQALLYKLSQIPGVWVPQEHGERLPKVAAADDAKLPATSAILTPHTELRSMFLIEPERGCSRGCTYCVMRRSTNGGMRLVSPERVKALLPDGIERVGLVGAAVTDHPKLPAILDHIVNERGLQVGISSLRADRLTDELVGLLAKGGYRTLTVASDGASERMRDKIERRTKARHIMRSAELAKQHGMKTLKVYMMVGLPDETDEDIDELVGFAKELSKVIRLAYGVAPFVAKRNTPLDGAPFAGIAEVEQRLSRLKLGLRGCAEVRPTSARWAWVEYLLAQGGADAGLRAYAAHLAGGSFAAWRRAFDGFTTYHEPSQAPVQPVPGAAHLRLPLIPLAADSR